MGATEKQLEIGRLLKENDLLDEENAAVVASLTDTEDQEQLLKWMKQKKTFTYSEMMRMVMSIEFPELDSLEDT